MTLKLLSLFIFSRYLFWRPLQNFSFSMETFWLQKNPLCCCKDYIGWVSTTGITLWCLWLQSFSFPNRLPLNYENQFQNQLGFFFVHHHHIKYTNVCPLLLTLNRDSVCNTRTSSQDIFWDVLKHSDSLEGCTNGFIVKQQGVQQRINLSVKKKNNLHLFRQVWVELHKNLDM